MKSKLADEIWDRVISKYDYYFRGDAIVPKIPYGSMCHPILGIDPRGKHREFVSMRQAMRETQISMCGLRSALADGEPAVNGWTFTRG